MVIVTDAPGAAPENVNVSQIRARAYADPGVGPVTPVTDTPTYPDPKFAVAAAELPVPASFNEPETPDAVE
jgi:hypothetical protein